MNAKGKLGSGRRTLGVLLFAGATACSGGGSVDIGEGTGQALADYAASWDGYAEAYTFSPSGSDRVRLVLDESGQGTMQFGDGPLLPPPADPDVGYPPGDGAAFSGPAGPRPVLREGFLYPVHETMVADKRLRLSVRVSDLYEAWCALQTPVPLGQDAFGCLPNDGFSWTADSCMVGSMPVDCGKLSLCLAGSGVCSCTATSCDAQPGPDTPFDAAFESAGAELVGTLIMPDSGARVTIRLNRN